MLATLALYSDRLFMGAVAVYVLAMLLHGGEYALSRTAPPALVAASGSAADGTDATPTGTTSTEAAPNGRSRSDRLGRMGVSLLILGAGLQAASIVTRGLAAGRWPLGNMYEFTCAICLAAVVAWLVVLRRWPAARPAGLFLLLPVIVLLFLAGTVLYAQAAPVMPALQSYWLVVHVTTVALASGLFFVPGVASLLYLLRRSGRWTELADRLPAAESLDRLLSLIHI